MNSLIGRKCKVIAYDDYSKIIGKIGEIVDVVYLKYTKYEYNTEGNIESKYKELFNNDIIFIILIDNKVYNISNEDIEILNDKDKVQCPMCKGTGLMKKANEENDLVISDYEFGE